MLNKRAALFGNECMLFIFEQRFLLLQKYASKHDLRRMLKRNILTLKNEIVLR